MKQMDITPEIITALAEARDSLMHMGAGEPERLSGLYVSYAARLAQAFKVLDDTGVFADVDERTDYATAEEILADAYQRSLPLAAVSRPGKLERVPGTDTLRPARQRLVSDALERDEAQEPVSDEWSARARAIEDIRPKGRRTED